MSEKMLKVEPTGPCLMIDPDGYIVDMSVVAKKAPVVTVPDSAFWRSRIVKGQLREVASPKKEVLDA